MSGSGNYVAAIIATPGVGIAFAIQPAVAFDVSHSNNIQHCLFTNSIRFLSRRIALALAVERRDPLNLVLGVTQDQKQWKLLFVLAWFRLCS